jgi:hypothetical protein
MKTFFKRSLIIAIGCIFCTFLCCKRPVTVDETENNLKSAMLNYLQHQPNYDPSLVKYEVVDVAYFDDPKKYYICDFKVRLKVPSKGVDTIGTMRGTVSHDFTEVHRKY